MVLMSEFECHAQIGNMIECMKKEQREIEILIEHYHVSRVIANVKRKKYINLDERLKTVVSNYNDYNDVLVYLRFIALNIKV